MSGYKLSLNSVRSINRTIVAVNQMRKTGITGDLPFRQNAKKVNATSLRIGKTRNGETWTKLTEATLEVWKRNAAGDMEQVTQDDGTAVTFTAFNIFATIDPDKFVACLNGFLISAEC